MAFSSLFSRHPWLTWSIFAFMLIVPILTRLISHDVLAVSWISYIMFGIVSTYIVYLGIADLFQFLLRRFFDAPTSVSLWALRTAMAATIISIVIGCVQALKPPVIRRVEVPVSDLNKSLEDFTIVQISDLHISNMLSKSSLVRMVIQINELSPNIIAITG
ncbi:MAG: hypothetical protein LBH03_03145, partial [Holophagales bacterium]|nr:hypothetical protein [Holophagales bacterium]